MVLISLYLFPQNMLQIDYTERDLSICHGGMNWNDA